MLKTTKGKLLLLIPAVMIIAAAVFFLTRGSSMEWNEETAVGNTAGNLNNNGMFCEANGVIYFSNPYDNHTLYSMNSDCTEPKKLNNDDVASINVFGNHIYYVRTNSNKDSAGVALRGRYFGICRTDLSGRNPVYLYDDICGITSLCGNYIYYQQYNENTGLSLYKIKIDGSENTKISDSEYNPAAVYDKKIYFSNVAENHNLMTLDTASGSISAYTNLDMNVNAYLPDMKGDYVYYIDLSKQYALVRMSTATRTVELLSGDRCINFNVYGNKIFYQVEGDTPALYRMNADGTQHELVGYGNFDNVCCTSQYTFFTRFENPDILYRVPTAKPIVEVEQIVIR